MKFIIKYGGTKFSVFVLIGLLVSALEGILLPQTIRLVITGLENKSINDMLLGMVFGIAGYLILGTGSYFYQYSIVKLLKNVNVNLTSLVFKNHILTYEKGHVESTSNVLSFIQNDISLLEENYVIAWIGTIQTLALAAVASGYIIAINPLLGVIFLAFALFTMVLPRFYQKKIQSTAENWTKANEFFTKELTENLKGTETIIGYQREKTFISRIKESAANEQNKTIKMTMAQALGNLTSYVSSYILSIIPFFIGGIFVLNGRLEVAALVAVFIASDRIANPLSVAAENMNKLSTTINIRNKIQRIDSENKENQRVVYDTDFSILPIEIRNGSLVFGEKIVLDDITMNIRTGEKILLIGESGSGKTSILNILQQHIRLTNGEIRFGELKEKDTLNIKQNISYIRQTPMIFNDSLLFNLTLGEDYQKQELQEAMKLAGLSTVLEERGFDYLVGENGQNLSGGQNQRLEIARAIMRRRELLIADEITASLDKETAKGIHETLLNLPQAVIEVSHHIKEENFKDYDRVYTIINKKSVAI